MLSFFLKILLGFAIIFTFAPKLLTAGDLPQKNPYSTGNAKRIVGIVTIPVASTLGGVMALSGALNSYPCKSDSSNYDKSKCQNARLSFYGGLALVGTGIVSGILLIRSGKGDRRKWDSWEKKHETTDASINLFMEPKQREFSSGGTASEGLLADSVLGLKYTLVL